MTSISNASGAPIDFKTPSGDDVVLSPLVFRDWGWVERMMRQEIINLSRDTCRDKTLSSIDRSEIRRSANEQASRISIASGETISGLLQSSTSMLKMLWLSLNKGDHKFSDEDIDRMFGPDMRAISKAVEIIFEISFPDDDDEADEADEADSPKTTPAATPTP